MKNKKVNLEKASGGSNSKEDVMKVTDSLSNLLQSEGHGYSINLYNGKETKSIIVDDNTNKVLKFKGK